MTKAEFEREYDNAVARYTWPLSKMVVAVKLPTGAIELIINTEQIQSKFAYYQSAYDADMRLKHNADIQIVACMFA